MKIRINYSLLILGAAAACTIVLVEGAVTFTDVAGKLEESFGSGEGECPDGAIRKILGGGEEPSCQAFTSISAALDADQGDVLGVARNTMLGLVDIEHRFKHLEKIHNELIDETHERYVFSDTVDQDQYGCIRQQILSVVANGANSGLFDFVPPGAVVGKRSDPTCIESRIVMVVEATEKYKTAGPEEKQMVTPENDLVLVTSTLPPAPPKPVESNDNGSNNSSTQVITIAISCLALAIAVPIVVFYFIHRPRRPRKIDFPPTLLSEWFSELSSHGQEQSELI